MMDKENDVKTQPDPLIDEIRSIRQQISDRFGNDVGRLCDFLQEQQQAHGQRVTNGSAEHEKTGHR